MSDPTIESILQEKRRFSPPQSFSDQAYIRSEREYEQLYSKAAANPEHFWGELAEQELHWFKKLDRYSIGNRPLPNGLPADSLIFSTTV